MAQATRKTIWTNFPLNDKEMRRLRDGTSGHRLLAVDEKSSEGLHAADIAFGQPPVELVISCPKLEWIHISSAGYTRYDRDEVRAALKARGAILSNSSHVFDDPCAEHLLAMMLAISRQLPIALTERNWRAAQDKTHARLLRGSTAVLVGYGAIARRLTELLAPFQMRLIGVRREPAGDEPIEMIQEAQLGSVLPLADHVVDILPAAPATTGFFNAERFEQMKASAVFYNVGRGATVDQAALRAALLDNRLAAAFLDVTHPEPLPETDRLWTIPQCYITPHTAGRHLGQKLRQVEHFLENLRRFQTKDAVIDRVV